MINSTKVKPEDICGIEIVPEKIDRNKNADERPGEAVDCIHHINTAHGFSEHYGDSLNFSIFMIVLRRVRKMRYIGDTLVLPDELP